MAKNHGSLIEQLSSFISESPLQLCPICSRTVQSPPVRRDGSYEVHNKLMTSTGAYHRVWRHHVEQEKIAPACRQPSGLPWQAAVHPSSTMRFLLGTRIHSDEPAVDSIITRTCCAVLSVEGQMCQTPAGFRSRRTASQVPHTQQNCCHGFHTRLSLKCESDDPEVLLRSCMHEAAAR